jgi:hypothetical protein
VAESFCFLSFLLHLGMGVKRGWKLEGTSDEGKAGIRLTQPPGTASGPQAGARTKWDLLDEAEEGGDAQVVCSSGDERAIGFAAVRAAEERRSER